ncbi:serine/threonine-protein phosphatase CPPED1-like [Anneissia japonica]|uniref:serine/threonine-protein phosphatase CPPED1-like n=1 Tax=Anneissia japonica TaxID=1529436 RepID=UPI0014256EBE|nr:serine/threonine-protein phosphatase CPPED1-like [Anneissia japonica]
MAVDVTVRANNRVIDGLQKENEGDWEGGFCFIQAADTQYGMIDSYEDNGDGTRWEKERLLTREAIRGANRMIPKPKFFIVCGDLVDAMPGSPVKDEQIRNLKDDLRLLDNSIPLICVCGNHDVGNSPTQESVDRYRESFGDDFFSFWVGGVKFLVVNSQYYEDSSQVPTLKKDQDQWLDQQLESEDWKHLVVFQHIPWFLRTPDEDDEYFNINTDVRLPMLEKFHKAGVRKIFCGHYHRNAGGFYQDLELIVTSAVGCQMGDQKSGFRVVTVNEKDIQHQYYELDQIPVNIKLH